MNAKQPLPPPPPGITVRDVYYVLFRHKWMIAALSLLAVAAALAVRFAWPVPYQSEAKLLIKWVSDSHAPDQVSPDVNFTKPASHGDNVINSELEILTSQDVIKQAVDVIGVSNLLARLGGGSNAMSAAVYIQLHLLPQVPKGSDVITLTFSHPDPAMPQQVLTRVIEAYLKKHNEIHRPEFSDFLRGEIDQVKGNLTETEKQLHAAKENANIISLEDSEKQAGEETARIEREIRETEAES